MKRTILITVVCFFVLVSANAKNLLAQVEEQDSLALVALYNATDGEHWTNNTNWLTESVPTWFGITVTDGRVTWIDLNNNNLVGTIPAEIGNLTDLHALYLYSNQLSGTLPIEIGNLANLNYLNLRDNQLSGSIPTEIGNLIYLGRLNLSYNQLSGNIPAEIGNLTHLTWLFLSVNQLSGSIPFEIGNLVNLTWLDLSINQLSGSIPSEIGNLTELHNLFLYQNQLSGTIPAEIANLTNLVGLALHLNQLTGEIPPEIGKLTQLTYLNLHSNQLSGAITVEIDSLKNLESLYLYNNQFVDLPDLSPDTSLAKLHIKNNKFTFEDIEPNIWVADFTYSPQADVSEDRDTTIAQGSPLELSASVGGTANHYQWTLNGTDIPGANGSSYTISAAEQADEGAYFCKITNTIATQLTLHSGTVHVTVSGGTGVTNQFTSIPKEFALFQNTPNPFNPTTSIGYKLAKPGMVKITIFDVNGKEVRQLVHENKAAGRYIAEWNGNDNFGSVVASGVYFYRLEIAEAGAGKQAFADVKKMIFMK